MLKKNIEVINPIYIALKAIPVNGCKMLPNLINLCIETIIIGISHFEGKNFGQIINLTTYAKETAHEIDSEKNISYANGSEINEKETEVIVIPTIS